jgi:PAS domain S-box-containing protein/putative nucleotidyltransferase with HDIG domain
MYSPLNERHFEGVVFSPEQGKFAVTFNDITERKLAEEKLNQSENRYRLATKATNDVIWEWNAKTHQLIWTENAQAVFGYSPDEQVFNEKWWDEHIHPDDRERVLTKLNDLIAGIETIWSEEYRFRRNDGTYLHISDHAYVERDANGGALRMIGAMSDVTAHKQAEDALRESEEQYRLLFENAPVGILSVTVEGQITEVNTAALQILGSPSAEATKSFNMLSFPPLVEAGISADFQNCIENGLPVSAERPYTTRWGKAIIIKYQMTPVLNEAGKIILIQVIIDDVTERKRAEEALKESEEKYRLLVENATIGIVIAQDQALKYINPKATELVGYSKEELLAIDFAERIHPDDREETIGYYLKFLQGEETPPDHIFRIIDKAGKTKWIDSNAVLVMWEGRPASLNFLMEITERKKAEEELRASEERFSTVFHASPMSIAVTWLEDNRLIDVNEAWQDLTGFTREEAISRSALDLDLWVERTMRDRLIELLHEGGTVKDFEFQMRRKSGEISELLFSAVAIDVAGEPCMLSMALDITERKRVEEALRESERRYRSLFEDSPISLWEEDFSEVKKRLDSLRQAGVSDFRAYFRDHPQFVVECASSVKIVDVNKATVELYQAKEKEELLKNLPFIFSNESYDAFAEELMYILAGDTQFAWEGTNRTVKGELLDISLTWSVIPGYEDDLSRVIVSITDITERKRAQEATQRRNAELTVLNKIGQALSKLADPSEIFKAIFTGIGQVLDNRNLYIALYDQSNQYISFPVYTMHGKHRSGADRPFSNGITEYVIRTNTPLLIKRGLAETLSQRGINMFGAKSRSFLAVPVRAGDKVLGVIALQDYDRENVYDEHHVELLTTIAAQATVALENARLYNEVQQELAERKRAEEALRQSNELLSLFIKQSPIYAYIKEVTPAESRVLWASENFQDMIGVPGSLMAGKAMGELFPPEFATKITADDWAVVSSGQVLKLDEDLNDRNYTTIKFPIAQGEKKLLAGYTIDITERKRAEKALRESEKKFKTLFEIAPVGISVLDREHNIVDTNYALQRITGLRKNEMVNGAHRRRTYLRPDGSLMPLDEFASTRAFKENMPIFDVETGIVTKDRGVVWTQVSAAPLDIPEASLVVITQDISERKLSEQTLRQRLAELETLYESGLSLSQLLEPKEIGQKIIDVLAEKLDWYHTTIRLYHPQDDVLELLAYNIAGETNEHEWQAIGERFRALIARPGDGLSGWALQHAETVRCGDVLQDQRYVETVPGVRSGLYVPIKTGERAIGVISVESEKPDYFTAEDEHLAVTLAAQAAVALENIRLFKDLQKSNEDLFHAYDKTIEGWSYALDLRDKETEGHTQRVTALTEELARAMGVQGADIVHLRRGALLHDIGKMSVPDRILLKPDKLTDDEWVIMRQHPVHAYNLLSRIEFLRPALNIPHYHHERWDGSGYPQGLRDEQIPLEARIFAVIDVYDALTSDRPYRPAWLRDKAIRYIQAQSGTHFDPQVVEAFLKLVSME